MFKKDKIKYVLITISNWKELAPFTLKMILQVNGISKQRVILKPEKTGLFFILNIILKSCEIIGWVKPNLIFVIYRVNLIYV